MNKAHKKYLDKLVKKGELSVMDFTAPLAKEFKISMEEARKILVEYINN
jgi:hypothetical protein